MSRMEPNRLLQDELVYELAVRGICGVGTCDSMRKTLRELLRLEKLGKTFASCLKPIPVDEEIVTCQNKLKEIVTLLEKFDGASNAYKKLETKICHIMGRIERIKPEEEEGHKARSELLSEVLSISADLEDKAEQFRKSRIENLPTDPVLLESLSVAGASTSTPVVHEPVENITVIENSNSNKYIRDIAKFDAKFSGDVSKVSVNAFLIQIEEFCASRNILKHQLFHAASELFEEPAKSWFRAKKRAGLSNWEDLVTELKLQFQPHDYNDRLWDEIKHRTQGSNEPIGIYVAIMSNLFSYLTFAVPENTRVKILRKNILPYLQSQLSCIDEIASEAELLNLCRTIERNRISIDAYVPPSRNKSKIEPDLSYIDNKARPQCSNAVTPPENDKECWNCNGRGHIAKYCKARRQKHCYRCGKKDFTKYDCPVCTKKSGNERRVQ